MYPDDEPKRAEYATADRGSKLPLTQQEKCILELHEVISVLTERLNPVLTPVPEQPMKDGGDKAVPSQSPLADQLDSNNRSIRKASNKVSALIERLEC